MRNFTQLAPIIRRSQRGKVKHELGLSCAKLSHGKVGIEPGFVDYSIIVIVCCSEMVYRGMENTNQGVLKILSESCQTGLQFCGG